MAAGVLLLTPAACATTVTVTGNVVSKREAALLWPMVTAYAGAVITTLLIVGSLPVDAAAANGDSLSAIGGFLALAPIVGSFGAIATTIVTVVAWQMAATDKASPDSFSLALFDVSSPFIGGAEPASKEAAKAKPVAVSPTPLPVVAQTAY